MSERKRHPGRSKHEKAMILHNNGNQYAVKGPKGSITLRAKGESYPFTDAELAAIEARNPKPKQKNHSKNKKRK